MMRRVTLRRQGAAGASGGIGVRFTKAVNGPCKIVHIAPGGPASQSQINLNDYIHELNGLTVHSMSVQDVVNEILGQNGSAVVLTVSDRELPFQSPQQPRAQPQPQPRAQPQPQPQRTPPHHQQQQQRTPPQQQQGGAQQQRTPVGTPRQQEQQITSAHRHLQPQWQQYDVHQRKQQHPHNPQIQPLMGRRPAPMSPEDNSDRGLPETPRGITPKSVAFSGITSTHALQLRSGVPPSIAFNINSSLQFQEQRPKATAEGDSFQIGNADSILQVSTGSQDKVKNQIVAIRNTESAAVRSILSKSSVTAQRSAPPPASEWSSPGGQRGDRITYSVLDRGGPGQQSGATPRKEPSPTSVRINDLKNTAEKIRSSLKRHSEDHAEAKIKVDQNVLVSPQRSAPQDQVAKEEQHVIPRTAPGKRPEGETGASSRDYAPTTNTNQPYRAQQHQGDVTPKTQEGGNDYATRSTDVSGANGSRVQTEHVTPNADPKYVTPKKPSASSRSLPIGSILNNSPSIGQTHSPGDCRPVAPIGGKGSAFKVVTPRKSPMRSKVNVANGSNESAQGLLKTGSAVRDPDVTVQSESAACEVDPSKYYLSMKPHSSHANQDAYEIHVWLGNTLQSQGALIKTHHDCLNLQAKLSERYLPLRGPNVSASNSVVAASNSVRSAEASSANFESAQTFLSSILQHEPFVTDSLVREFFRPVPISFLSAKDQQEKLRKELENIKMEREMLREQLAKAHSEVDLQHKNMQKQLINHEDSELNLEREKNALHKVILDLQNQVEIYRKWHETEKGKQGTLDAPSAPNVGADGRAAQNGSLYAQEITNSISVPVLSKAYEGWMARELKSREDAQRVREDELVSALSQALNESNYWKSEAARQRELYTQAIAERSGEHAGQLASDGADAKVLKTRRNLHLDNASDAAKTTFLNKQNYSNNQASSTGRTAREMPLSGPSSGVVVNGKGNCKGNTAPPGGATPEDHQSTRHPAIEISALPTSDRREHDILQDAATAKARDRNPLGRNGTDIPRLSISSLPRPLENAPSSDTMAHKIGAGVLGTARRHFPMETMETQAMVPDLQEEDGSLTARTSGTSPFDSGNTPSVPGLQIVTPRMGAVAEEMIHAGGSEYEQLSREYRLGDSHLRVDAIPLNTPRELHGRLGAWGH